MTSSLTLVIWEEFFNFLSSRASYSLRLFDGNNFILSFLSINLGDCCEDEEEIFVSSGEVVSVDDGDPVDWVGEERGLDDLGDSVDCEDGNWGKTK